jgi:hypothetical protein
MLVAVLVIAVAVALSAVYAWRHRGDAARGDAPLGAEGAVPPLDHGGVAHHGGGHDGGGGMPHGGGHG